MKAFRLVFLTQQCFRLLPARMQGLCIIPKLLKFYFSVTIRGDLKRRLKIIYYFNAAKSNSDGEKLGSVLTS